MTKIAILSTFVVIGLAALLAVALDVSVARVLVLAPAIVISVGISVAVAMLLGRAAWESLRGLLRGR